MKIKHSLLDRRNFLNTLFGGWMAALFAGLFYPVIRAVFPNKDKEPDYVILNGEDIASLNTNHPFTFAWGANPGILVKKEDGSFKALKGVCTHLDCNVTYRPAKRDYFCACHKGRFNEDGINVEGPPPKPLQSFTVTPKGSQLIISREGFDIESIPEIS
jgi:Rieske Fe-S protein